MNETTINNLRSIAPQLLTGKSPYPAPSYAQHALSILKILDDGEWHTAGEIAEQIGIGKKYVRDILRACKDDWGLAFSNPQGWMLVKDNSVIIV